VAPAQASQPPLQSRLRAARQKAQQPRQARRVRRRPLHAAAAAGSSAAAAAAAAAALLSSCVQASAADWAAVHPAAVACLHVLTGLVTYRMMANVQVTYNHGKIHSRGPTRLQSTQRSSFVAACIMAAAPDHHLCLA
jgi:hypothetical protein